MRPALVPVAFACAASLAVAAPGASTTAAVPTRPLRTAIVDAAAFGGSDAPAAFANARKAGAGMVRLVLDWSVVAPAGTRRPAGFSPRRPDDPLYRWEGFDLQVTGAVEAGLTPIVDIVGAPAWAEGVVAVKRPQDGPYRPSPRELGSFAFAAATRYAGGFRGLPRVRNWQVWNEPNFSYYLIPQSDNGRLVSPGWYRAMLNESAKAIRAVHTDNVVVAAGLAPYGAETETLDGTAPLRFMRALLCLSDDPVPRRTCRATVAFDAWAHHPYTSGGPTREAGRPDDVALGDLDEMRKVLRAAERLGAIRSRGAVRFWVTEFSWDTAPPDPKGVPSALHARWVSEALYRMWSDGVQVVTWFLVRDEPFPDVSTQSGLYYRGAAGVASDRPKPSRQAFRFPFVAFREGGRVAFWGKAPAGPGTVVALERSGPGGWKAVAYVRAGVTGVFGGSVRVGGAPSSLRARQTRGGERSVPFALRSPPDRDVCPFGTC